MKPQETWRHIHSERAQMAETWADLSPGQWAAASWCGGWSVQDVAGHVVAAAEQTPANFYKEMAMAGFRFNVFADRAAKRIAAAARRTGPPPPGANLNHQPPSGAGDGHVGRDRRPRRGHPPAFGLGAPPARGGPDSRC